MDWCRATDITVQKIKSFTKGQKSRSRKGLLTKLSWNAIAKVTTPPHEDSFLMDSNPTLNSQTTTATLATPESPSVVTLASSKVQLNHTYSSQTTPTSPTPSKATPTDPTPSEGEAHVTEELLSQELLFLVEVEVCSEEASKSDAGQVSPHTLLTNLQPDATDTASTGADTGTDTTDANSMSVETTPAEMNGMECEKDQTETGMELDKDRMELERDGMESGAGGRVEIKKVKQDGMESEKNGMELRLLGMEPGSVDSKLAQGTVSPAVSTGSVAEASTPNSDSNPTTICGPTTPPKSDDSALAKAPPLSSADHTPSTGEGVRENGSSSFYKEDLVRLLGCKGMVEDLRSDQLIHLSTKLIAFLAAINAKQAASQQPELCP